MRLLKRLLLVLALATIALPSISAAQEDSGERLGVRAGYMSSDDGLYEYYGDGWDLTLYFTEHLYRKLLLNVQLAAIYLGDARVPDLDDQLTVSYGIVSQMRFFYFSVGPMLRIPIGQSWATCAAAGVGIYSVSVSFSSAITAFDYSDQHVGFNGGLGVTRRITGNVSAELNGSVHYVNVDENLTDLYWAFTNGGDAPLMLGLALGVVVDLH